MYVIDPRSSEPLNGSDYNDDSGEGFNPIITKNLTANIPYLVIYSSYNLSTTPESEYIVLNVNKN